MKTHSLALILISLAPFAIAKSCRYDYQCKANEKCISGECVPKYGGGGDSSSGESRDVECIDSDDD